ncbi:MAG: acyltransferase [Patescibacteria group bacterium]|nr:acyltransferase [Patescibacteria group bacterium]MDE2590780.1 acyltransferase [Patescibacteria group bacterium]
MGGSGRDGEDAWWGTQSTGKTSRTWRRGLGIDSLVANPNDMKPKERFVEIDLLRGLAMFAMILIHTNAYFLSSSSLVEQLWDWSQFAVPVFLLCSAYLFFVKTPEFTVSYLVKRFKRLLIPYYIFMLFFFGAILLREPQKLTGQYITQSILLTGGIDINWLALLFLELTFVIPLVSFLWNKSKLAFGIFGLLSLASSIAFIFFKWPYDYKLIMWLPYGLLIIYTLLLAKFHARKWFYPVSLIAGGGIYLGLRFIETGMHHSLTFYDNKYPPNLYFLSYGIFSLALLHFLIKKGILSWRPAKQLMNFLSINSYQLFFVHYLLMYLISWTFQWIHFNWLTFFLAVLSSSLIVWWVVLRSQKFLFRT